MSFKLSSGDGIDHIGQTCLTLPVWVTTSIHAIIQSNGQYELQKRVLVADSSFNNPAIFFIYRAIQKAHPV